MTNSKANSTDLELNLKLYPWYQAATGFMPWLPVFFLFFFQYVNLSDAIKLGAVYYFSVFLLEVPSGYFSDRFGRRITLLLSATFAIIAYLVFILSTSFQGFAIGQFMLAAYFSFKSGSDNSLLFDTLSTLDRTSEYAHREANAARFSMLAFAAAALLGGLSGTLNLSLPYYLSLLGAATAFFICIKFSEPPVNESAEPFLRQLSICIERIRQPQLLWLFGFFIFAYSLMHVPAEFNQPYIKLLQINIFSSTDSSPLISGVMVAISMAGGALGATFSMAMVNRLGVRMLLLSGLILMVVVIAGMAIVLHPIVLLLVLFRNLPMALCEPPMLAAIAPHVQSHYRATYLSMQSLAGRLAFSVMLFSLSNIAQFNDDATMLSWPNLQLALLLSLGIGLVCLIVLYLYRIRFSD